MKLYKSTTAGVYLSERQNAAFRVTRMIVPTNGKYVITRRDPELCHGVVIYFNWDVVAYVQTLKEAMQFIDNCYNPHG